MSKKFRPTDPDVDGTPNRGSGDGTSAGTDRERAPRVDGDDDAISPTRLVFGMGSVPKETAPRLDRDERAGLEAAGVDPDAVTNKEYSYRMLLDADVDEPLADDLRRRFSLPWSFENDGDLDRRSSEVRGLGDAEREWIARSGDEEWQSFDAADSRELDIERETPEQRPHPKPTPTTAVTGVGPDDADRLAEAGVISAKRLSTINAFEVANLLDLNVLHVRTWRHNARELID